MTTDDLQDREQPLTAQETVAQLQGLLAQRDRLLRDERDRRIAAERAVAARDAFLNTAAHELRTPLNAILGWSQLVASDKRLPAELKRSLGTIHRNATAQAALIEDLLDLARVMAGTLKVDRQPVDLGVVAEAAAEAAAPLLKSRTQKLELDVDGEFPLSGDAARLQQVVRTLLAQASRATAEGSPVQLGLKRAGPNLQLTVTSGGEGLSTEQLAAVVDGSTTTGLGIGMSVARHVVALHGGRLAVEAAGAGSRLVLTLPLQLASEQDAGAEPAEPTWPAEPPVGAAPATLAGLRVLAIDDEEDARMLLQTLLEDAHAQVTAASSVAAALELVGKERFDLVVSDIGMPGEYGYAFIRQLRALDESHGGKTPAVALTAMARDEDRQRALMSGFQVHLTKPVDPEQLVAVMAALVPGPRALEDAP